MLAKETTISRPQRETISSHYNVLVGLLDLEAPWRAIDTNVPSNAQLGKYRREDIIEEVSVEYEGGDMYRYYEIADPARDVLERMREGVDTPCEHRGIRNLGDGEYTCGAEFCDVRFGRDTAREAMEGML